MTGSYFSTHAHTHYAGVHVRSHVIKVPKTTATKKKTEQPPKNHAHKANKFWPGPTHIKLRVIVDVM